MKLAIGTRFWGKRIEDDLPRITDFIKAAQRIGQVFVAVNANEDKIGTVELFPNVAFPVTPWGKFVQPLNAIILKAAEARVDYLLMASAEFPPTQEQVDVMASHLDGATLVVGAKFAEHEFSSGKLVAGTGTTVPWNTFALWNLNLLSMFGVPMIGDAHFDPKMAGVEEVATIAMYQRMITYTEAKLVRVPEIGGEWNTAGWSEERLAKHRAKIESKKSRPAAQLKHLGLDDPVIIHITERTIEDPLHGHEWRDLTVTQKRGFKKTGKI